MSSLLAVVTGFLFTVHVSPVRANGTINPSLLPFDPLTKDELRASPRKTFIRWHVEPVSTDNRDPATDYYARNLMSPTGYNGLYATFGGMARHRPLPRPPVPAADWKIIDMAVEVERAINLGADGFAFSIFQLPPKDGWQKLLNMLEAARRVDGAFRVKLSLDYPSLNGSRPTADTLADAIAGIAAHPSLFRADDGRLVVMGMAPDLFGPAYNADLVAALAKRGVSVYFVPVAHQWTELNKYAAIASGYGRYGADNPTSAPRYASSVATAHAQGKIYMGTVQPQLFRPRRGYYVEAQNSETLRTTWKVAIDSQPDWLLIRNWNDYAEGNQISPATGTQWAFYDLSAYYNTWYKTGLQPQIKRDVLYYVHRIHATTTMPEKQTQLIKAQQSNPEGTRDNIELLAFLTAPGTLETQIGGTTTQYNAPAGITSFKVPLANGIPAFKLIRGGATVVHMISAFEVRDRIDYQDLLYRAGGSTRPMVEMVANPPLLP